MKLFKLTVAVAILFSIVSINKIQAQRFYGSLSAGMNLSQVDGDEEYGFHKAGFNGGPAVMFPFGKNKNWSVTMELLYSQMGSYAKSEYGQFDTIYDSVNYGYYDGYKLKLDYAEIPILIHYTDKQVVAGGIGFQYGTLLSSKEWEDFNDARGYVRTDSIPFKKSDMQILVDVRLRLYKRLWFNFRYNYSLVPIRTREFENPFTHSTWTRKQYNNVLTFRLTYIFNDPLPVKRKH